MPTLIINQQGTSHIDNLTLHHKEEEQTEPKFSRRKEIIKITVEISEIRNRRTIEKINRTKSWCFEKMSKVDNP